MTFALLWILQLAHGQADSTAGQHLYFDGSSQYVDTRDTSLYRKFTVECWVKSPNAPSNLQGKGPVHFEKNFQINWDHVSASFRAAVGLNVSNGGWKAASFGNLEANTWYHLAGTYDGDTLKAYTNGILVSQLPLNGGDPLKEEFSLKIGKHAKLSGSQEFFNGSVDEVRVWDRELTAGEIRRHMYHPLGGNEPGLKHYYQFNSQQVSNGTVQNLAVSAAGGLAQQVNQPMAQASDFPFGRGNTQIFNVSPNTEHFFNSSSNGVLYIEVDSASASFPLLSTRLESAYFGQSPDSSFYAYSRKPYFILRQLSESPIPFKAKGLRFFGEVLPQSLSSQIQTPDQLKIFSRPNNSSEDWLLADTCAIIAWSSGHYIFNSFPLGQITLGISGLVSSKAAPVVFQDNAFFSSESGIIWIEKSDRNAREIRLADVLGKEFSLEKIAETQRLQAYRTSIPIKAGVYFIYGTGRAPIKLYIPAMH